MPVRTSTKAIIIEDGKLLCSQFQNKEGRIYYGLPGGGQEQGESLPEALKRECYEEILAEVEVQDVCFIRDYIRQNHIAVPDDDHFHQVDFFFTARLLKREGLGIGPVPDTRQIGVAWISVEALSPDHFFPGALVPYLQQGDWARGPIYLGDVD